MTLASRARQARRRVVRRGATTVLAAIALLLGACDLPTVPFPNGPEEGQFKSITSPDQIQGLATGLLDGDRASHAGQILFLETMARDMFQIDPSESRFITELLGTGIDASNFIGSGLWGGPYRHVRGADLLIEGTDAAASTVLSAEQKASTKGFARTVKAMLLMRLIDTRDLAGIPIEVRPGENAPIRCKPAVLDYIGALLDSAATDLQGGGGAFVFSLPSGFTGFDTPDTFLKFNRALKAKIDYYRGFLPVQLNATAAPNADRLNSALTELAGSFYTPSSARADLDRGIYHVYSTASGELTNGLYDLGVIRANPKLINGTVLGGDAPEAGDLRIRTKIDTSSTNALLSGSGVSSRIILRQPANPTSPLGYLRNEELILMRGQVLWGLDRFAEAIDMINIVRAGAGLPALSAATLDTKEKVIKQLLKEKRYSLMFESNARLVDHRLLNRMSDLGLELGHAALASLPIPSNESVARSGDIACKP
jgi:hypothetical protein